MAKRNVKTGSYSIVDKKLRRRAGRPRSFDRESALDHAVEMFWADGYEGVDVERIARAVGVTKPSLYRAFGDKAALFLRALQRYSRTQAAGALAAFEAEPDITRAVAAFCKVAITTITSDGRAGCLLACTAATSKGSAADVRDLLVKRQATVVNRMTNRFEHEMAAGRLSPSVPARTRAQFLIDLMQGMALRASTGAAGRELRADAWRYMPLLLK